MTGPAAGCVQGCRGGGNGAAPKPCASQGMSNQNGIDDFARQMAGLKTKWKTLTADQRRAALQKIVDDAGTYADFPAPKVVMKPLRTGLNGELDFANWDIDINQSLAANDNITDAEFANLSDTIYHETRHAEQWWLIARRDAAEGLSADEIATKRGINNGAITKAAKKAPLAKGAPRRACADAMYESVYGTGRDSRNAVLNALGPNRTATDAAAAKATASNAAYTRINADPGASAADKTAAYNQAVTDYAVYTTTKAAQDTNYLAYRALPEEADAWDSGGRAGKAVTKALNKGGH